MDIEHDQYIEALIAVGGNPWAKGEHYRLYFDDPALLAGLELEHYGTGNISSAAWRGEGIANSQGALISASVEKLWFDVPTWRWQARFGNAKASRHATKQEVLDAAVEHVKEMAATWLADKYGDRTDSE